jgi:hypothetical protein
MGGMGLRCAASRERARDACPLPCYARSMNTQKIGTGVALVIGALALGCGGKSLQVGGDGGGGGSGGSGGGGMDDSGGDLDSASKDVTVASDSGTPTDTGLPSPDSPQCDIQDTGGAAAPCILCSDEKWHCGSIVYEQCPPSAVRGGKCTSPGEQCINCWSDGGAEALTCYVMENGWGESSNYACIH